MNGSISGGLVFGSACDVESLGALVAKTGLTLDRRRWLSPEVTRMDSGEWCCNMRSILRRRSRLDNGQDCLLPLTTHGIIGKT